MNGFPLGTAKKLLKDLIGNLNPQDRFNVILFSGGSVLMAPNSLPATAQNIERAIDVINRQRGGGGTELLSALKRAMNLPQEQKMSRSFVVVTDGYIDAEKSVFQYIRDHLGDANVFSFGIGSSVNRYLVEGIARAGMGEPFVVTEPAQAYPVATKFREYIQSPVLTNIQVQYSGFRAFDVEPVSIPDLLAQRPIIVFGKWAGKPEGSIEVSGLSGSGAYKRGFYVSQQIPSKTNHAIRYLWARSRIAALSDFGFGDQDQDQKSEIVSLGLSYNLLTRYTSFVAVHQVVRNKNAPARDVQQPLPLPQGVSNLAVGFEPELMLIALLMFVLAAARLWWVKLGKVDTTQS